MSVQNTLEKLISFDTTVGNYEEMLNAYAWIKQELGELPLYYMHHERNGVPSLVITTKPDHMNPKLFLAAHIDVVPGEPEQFEPRVKDGKLLGRGVFDMKFAIACYIETLKAIGDDLAQYDIGVMITGDEENTGIDGTNYLMDLGYRCDVMLLPDGGPNWHFEIEAKGVWRFIVTSHGKSVHSSRPWQGENAIEPLNHFLHKVTAIFETYQNDDPDCWYTTGCITRITGGTGSNVVPDFAEAVVDARFVSDQDIKEIKEKVYHLAQDFPAISIRTNVDMERYGLSDTKILTPFIEHAKRLHGIECGTVKSHGTTDARFAVSHGIPVLVIYPNGGDHHGKNEWIDIEDLNRFYDVTLAWVMSEGKR